LFSGTKRERQFVGPVAGVGRVAAEKVLAIFRCRDTVELGDLVATGVRPSGCQVELFGVGLLEVVGTAHAQRIQAAGSLDLSRIMAAVAAAAMRFQFFVVLPRIVVSPAVARCSTAVAWWAFLSGICRVREKRGLSPSRFLPPGKWSKPGQFPDRTAEWVAETPRAPINGL
jgi:hypothetical protein